ncbi:MAG: peptidylprolyl isomerase [Proteobacteria bacterium]|nr:peptidylprolyl isomerase [Pseudomonadota bacterium]MCP4919869.1 peptidylprolyl isomerase [Pseudomonadota bacterium]
MSFFRRSAPDTPAPDIQEMFPGDGPLYCRFKTSQGDMVAELYDKRAPRTVANFVGLATGKVEWEKQGRKTTEPLYSGTIFHRVIENFMLQGGDPEGTGRGGPGYRWKDEFHKELKHTGKGTLSMANAGPDTNGSQFFVCQVPTAWLDGKHAVFGKVIENDALIDVIASVPKGRGDRPIEDVVLHEVEVWRD